MGRASFPIFFVPWIVVCVSIVIMDIVATVFYVMDSVQVTVRFETKQKKPDQLAIC
jgi:hypothetical protein